MKCGDGKCQRKNWGNKVMWDEGWGCGSAAIKINNGRYEISWEKECLEKLRECIGYNYVWEVR